MRRKENFTVTSGEDRLAPSLPGPTRRRVLTAAGLLGATLLARPGFAADGFPSRSVRVIVNTGAGSGTDIIGRVVAKQLTQQTGQSFVVENHTGAGGIIGNQLVATSPPDGYTQIVMDTGMSITANMFKSLPYDPVNGFTPITQISRTPTVLVINPSLNIHTVQELIAYAKANPGKLNYGSSGVGGSIQIYFERFKAATQTNITHIPYDGGSTMLAAALRNDVQLLMTALQTTKSYVKSGQLRALAVTTDGKRVPSLPDVPSMAEAGVPNMTIYSWAGLGAPAKMPADVLAQANAQVVKALAVPSVKDWFASQDAETVGSSPADFTKFFHDEVQRWGDVIKVAGIPVNP